MECIIPFRTKIGDKNWGGNSRTKHVFVAVLTWHILIHLLIIWRTINSNEYLNNQILNKPWRVFVFPFLHWLILINVPFVSKQKSSLFVLEKFLCLVKPVYNYSRTIEKWQNIFQSQWFDSIIWWPLYILHIITVNAGFV